MGLRLLLEEISYRKLNYKPFLLSNNEIRYNFVIKRPISQKEFFLISFWIENLKSKSTFKYVKGVVLEKRLLKAVDKTMIKTNLDKFIFRLIKKGGKEDEKKFFSYYFKNNEKIYI